MEKTRMINKTLKLAQFISKWSQVDFAWGETDCMMFAISLHDARFDTTKAESIYRKYNDRFSAIRFYKNFVKLESWLKNNQYKKLTAKKPKLQDGDVIVKNHKTLDQAWIFFNESLYIMDEERGLIRIQTDLIESDSVWRR